LSRGWKIGLGIVAGLVVFDLALQALGNVTGGTPGGPRSSSYATGRTGLGAYAELLGKAGHPVSRPRGLPRSLRLGRGATVVLLDPAFVQRDDARALAAFVRRGGRLVAGGASSGWLGYLLSDRPRWTSSAPGRVRQLAPAPELDGVRRVTTAGEGAWDDTGQALPLLGDRDGALLAAARLGRGRVLLLADPSPLQNRLLGESDNAALGLALAGARGRPVAFLETYHGYGRSSGLAALPTSWKVLLGVLALAALTYMVARGRRLGPPEAEGRALAPPRRAYVDALGAALARTRRPHEAVEPLRLRGRARLARRAGLEPDADDDAVRAAASRVGVSDADLEALLTPVARESDVLAVGRALAHVGHDDGGRR
jgi:hypothetical protein